MRHRRHQAFTLVEILIVVIILGILASIVIGVFANASSDASAKALKDNLRNMRAQIQLYVAQHGTTPPATTFAQQMTLYSDGMGNTSVVRDQAHPYGPYILDLPRMPIGTEKGKVTVTTGTTYVPGFAWRYDATTGQFKANLPDTDLDADGVAMNQY